MIYLLNFACLMQVIVIPNQFLTNIDNFSLFLPFPVYNNEYKCIGKHFMSHNNTHHHHHLKWLNDCFNNNSIIINVNLTESAKRVRDINIMHTINYTMKHRQRESQSIYLSIFYVL